MSDRDWKVDNAAGRVWWDHKNDNVPRVWLESDGTFFFNLPNDETGRCPGQSRHDSFECAASAAIAA